MIAKHNLLKTLLLFIAMTLPLAGFAQKQYKVYKSNGEIIEYDYNEIDSVVFRNYTVAPIADDCEYVDLGLSVKWATRNLGAEKVYEVGDYYAWSEIETKNSFTENNCPNFNADIPDFSGNPEYDAATYALGEGWRMPTHEQCEELSLNCYWEWTEVNGKGGFKITGPSGKAIFLPAAGYKYGTHVSEDDVNGYYWTSTPDHAGAAMCLSFMKGDWCGGWCVAFRDSGFLIRPIHD